MKLDSKERKADHCSWSALCVNQNGERVLDQHVNVLTVIPNESNEAFAKALQQESEEETGVSFEGRVKNARAKARIQRKSLSAEEENLSKTIWNKINYQTRYSVSLDTAKCWNDWTLAFFYFSLPKGIQKI
ncbi:MAG: hypothetical protein ACO23B_11035 [Burkholderiaceae bacterium]